VSGLTESSIGTPVTRKLGSVVTAGTVCARSDSAARSVAVKRREEVGSFMDVMPDPKQTPEKRGAARLHGATCGACCFLRRHDPFQVRRVEQPVAPQSQPSAEDTPTGNADKSPAPPQRKQSLPAKGFHAKTRSREETRPIVRSPDSSLSGCFPTLRLRVSARNCLGSFHPALPHITAAANDTA